MGVDMKVRHRAGLPSAAAWLAAAILTSVPAEASSDPEMVREIIHSRLPLYTFDWENLWPRNFRAGDTFGCTSRVRFGDWRFTPAEANDQEDESWYRIDNYGVFHCAAVLPRADERDALAAAQWRYGFFVRLGNARHRSEEWELWALQWGMRPGSEYVLLAREAGGPEVIGEFRVLQQRCPRGMIREVDGLDVWSTRYCAVDSRAELLSLARRMLRLPVTGTLVHVSDVSRDGSAGVAPTP